nr:integrase, catalytic region, zinc finger, CCHC-type, peptidase aspartic, catalytic [Tanacetum cinerariifolium]
MSSSNSSTQNIALVTSSNNNITNGAVNTAQAVNTTIGVSTAGTQVNIANINNLSDVVICAFLASQPSSPQLVNNDFEHIHSDDFEEIDLRWQMAMLTIRSRRGYFARECRAPRSQDTKHKESTRRIMPMETTALTTLVSYDGLKSVEERLKFFKTNESVYIEDIKLLKFKTQMKDIVIKDLRRKLEVSLKEKEGIQLPVEKLKNASKSLYKLIDCQIIDNCKKGLGYESYNTVPPSYIGNFMPPKPDLSYIGLDEFADKPVVENCAKTSETKPKDVRKNNDAPIIEEWVSDDEEEEVTQPKIVQKQLNLSNGFASTKANVNAGQTSKEKAPVKDYILLPLWITDPPFSQQSKSSQDDGFEPSNNVNSTNTVNVAGTNEVNTVGAKTNNELPFDYEMPALEVISTFNFLSDHEDDDEMADMNNLDTTIQNKKDERGIVIRNKARLVAQGHTQEEGIDYDEVFALVARIEAIRLFLAYASFKDFAVYQMDVKSAFLYRKIKEEVYVCKPLRFKDPDFPDKVYKLKKALYGLHQAPGACQDKYVVEILKKYGFSEVKNASTPMETQKPLLKDGDGKEVDVHMYRSMIGSLMYLTSSRPDLMYLKGQPKFGLLVSKYSSFHLVAYTDSDYARASLDRKSTTGGCQFLGCRLISWQYKKQTVVVNSITKAEYPVLSGKENRMNILKSIDEGPFQIGIVREPLAEGTEGTPHLGQERPRVYSDLSPENKDRYNANIRATNILLHGLPKDIYTFINHYTDAKDIWDNVKMLLEGSELTKEDRESQLNIKMTMSRMQLSSKFVNNMLPEWGRFVTTVKLNRGLRDSNYDQLVMVQNVKGPQNRGQGTNSQGGGVAGYGGFQNRVGNDNPSQARQVALDKEQLLFLTGGQDNAIDEDVDAQLVQDLALNVDNVFQADDCDAFDSDVDEAPTGQQFRGQGTNPRGGGAAGFGEVQNRVGNANRGQARQNSDYYKDKMLLMQAQENMVALDEEHLLFLAGGQDTAIDEDVDYQPIQDLELYVDNVFQVDDCDVFNSDVDESLTAQTMFLANLSSADPVNDEVGPSYDSDILSEVQDHDHYQDTVCAHHEEHVMHDNVQLNHVVDSHADYTSDSNMIPYDQYVKYNAMLVVHSNVSSVPNDAYMMIDNDMYEPHSQSVSTTSLNTVGENSLTAKLATYKEQVDKTCKKRITPTRLTEGEWGFEQTKECYLKEVIPFLKTLKENFKGIQKALTTKIKEMKDVFKELEAEVAQCGVDRKLDEIERNNLLIENDNLISKCLSKEVFSVATNSELNVARFTEMHVAHTIVEKRCLELEAGLSNLRDKSHNNNHDELVKRFSNLEVHHLNLQLKYQNLKDSFRNKLPTPDKDTLDFDSIFVISKMQASLQGKDNIIKKLQNQISHSQETCSEAGRTLKVRAIDSQITQLTKNVTVLQAQNDLFRAENNKIKQHYKEFISKDHVQPKVPAPGKYAIDVEPIVPRLRNNREAHLDYLKHLKESVETIRDIVEEAKVVQIFLWYLDSGCSKHMTEDCSRLMNFMKKFIGIVKFGNDHFGAIMGYGDYVIGDSVISRVYYVEGLGHNLFSVRQLCDADLEVAFRKHSCYVRDTDGVELIKGPRMSNLYTILVEDMMKSSPICLLSKASKNKSWLWHRHLNHLNFVSRTPQQNGIVERRNRMLVEASRTMLIFSKASMFLWAEAVATACYTQNRSLIHSRYNKTPYELVHNKKPDLTFFRVFGALCYPTNDREDLGKLQPTADIEIFVGYAPSRKGYRIYNKRTRRIMETIHVQFDELTASMAFVHLSTRPAPIFLTPGQISSWLVPNPVPAAPYVPPTNKDLEILF